MQRRYMVGLALGGLGLVAVATQVFNDESPMTRLEMIEAAQEEADRLLADLKEARAAEQAKMDAMSPEELDAYLVEKTEVLQRFEEEQRDFNRQLRIHEAILRSGQRGYDI